MIMENLNKPDDELLFYAINAGLRLNMDIIEFVFRAAKKIQLNILVTFIFFIKIQNMQMN